FDSKFGLVEFQRGISVNDSKFGRLFPELLGVLRQRFQIRSAQHEIDLGPAAPDIERLGVANRGPQVFVFSKPGANLLHYIALRVIGIECLQRLPVNESLPQSRKGERALLDRRDTDVSAALIDSPDESAAHACK